MLTMAHFTLKYNQAPLNQKIVFIVNLLKLIPHRCEQTLVVKGGCIIFDDSTDRTCENGCGQQGLSA